MMDAIRSLPQGMFWYSLLLFLTIALGRAIWRISRKPAWRRRTVASVPESLEALKTLIVRADSDWYSRQELERRCIGLFLQMSGYAGYSIENCRSFAGANPHSAAAEAIAGHLADGESGRVRGYGPATGGDDRVVTMLEAIEAMTEAPVG